MALRRDCERELAEYTRELYQYAETNAVDEKVKHECEEHKKSEACEDAKWTEASLKATLKGIQEAQREFASCLKAK